MSYEQWPYLGVFLVLLACGLGLPLPEDIPLLTGGWLVHQELAHLYLMIPVAILGVLGGDCILFSLGKRFGHRIVEHRFLRRIVNPARLLVAERLFERHGIKIIFIGRFLPGLRPMIFMAAGVLRVPLVTFLGVNGFAACISVPVLIVLGMVFGENLERIQSDVRKVSHLLVFIVLASLLILGVIYFHRRQKRLLAEAGIVGKIGPDTLAQTPPQSEPFSENGREASRAAPTPPADP